MNKVIMTGYVVKDPEVMNLKGRGAETKGHRNMD